ncbi:LacI family DNA-binding transcriptional regulator [Ectobacillus ponti]|uniref:LacI family DNA-binding transcriptional regulator n=1 Tax=Ectobacillus ponti TaxID=2961894 RepID=A0AA42BRV1_9BACI|nr:LacI family DNA-binding transcriptional regulator [Ectobacillus ponti]MCP8967738.1 LacI family DNA-binding transcriptional regulator [Ectobacillus ponti]
MANIKEIAARAGVSISTVSRVLNNHPYVSEEKRQAVQRIIDELDYSQNLNAIHLLKGRTYTIGVMLPFANLPYFNMMIEGIAAAALESGYRLTLCQTNYDRQEEMKVFEMLKMRQFDGVIVCSAASSWDQMEPYAGQHAVLACENTAPYAISSVHMNHYEGFSMGMQYLIQKEHRHIGYCMARRNSFNSRSREQAYRDALAAIGEDVREDWMLHDCYSVEDGEQAMRHLLQLPSRPTALFASSDQVAAGLLAEARRQGLRVPEDLAVLGFDDQPIARALDLTTIAHPLVELGRQAFQALHERIEDPSLDIVRRELAFRLVERMTV